MRLDCSEKDIECWIISRAELCGEPLLVLRTQSPIRRTADVIALDEHGRLVIIEIKNERSTRRAVGQILEYLWQYRNATIEDLEDDYAEGHPEDTGTLGDAYRERFRKPLKRLRGIRFVLIASSFDVNTTFGVRYLRDVAKQTCALVEVAEPKRGHFKFTPYELPDLVRAGSLTVGDFAIARGRLFCVLAEGRLPVLWNVGRSKSSGQLRLLGQQTLLRRCLQLKNRTVIPVPKPADVSLEHSGSLWYRPARPRWCLLVGSVDGARAAAQ